MAYHYRLFFAFFCSFSLSTEAASLSLDVAQKHVMFYYQDPIPGSIMDDLKLLAPSVHSKPSAVFNLQYFLYVLLEKNPSYQNQWCAQLKTFDPEYQAMFAISFQNVNHASAAGCLKDLRLSEAVRIDLSRKRRYDVMMQPTVSSLSDLDALWVTFMASGEAAPVNKIIDILAQAKPQRTDKNAVQILLLQGAARWSLTANIRQHPRVREIVRRRLQTADGILRDNLQKILAAADNNH